MAISHGVPAATNRPSCRVWPPLGSLKKTTNQPLYGSSNLLELLQFASVYGDSMDLFFGLNEKVSTRMFTTWRKLWIWGEPGIPEIARNGDTVFFCTSFEGDERSVPVPIYPNMEVSQNGLPLDIIHFSIGIFHETIQFLGLPPF